MKAECPKKQRDEGLRDAEKFFGDEETASAVLSLLAGRDVRVKFRPADAPRGGGQSADASGSSDA
jgi:hypothetical protein